MRGEMETVGQRLRRESEEEKREARRQWKQENRKPDQHRVSWGPSNASDHEYPLCFPSEE